jgi:hypothetical protein
MKHKPNEIRIGNLIEKNNLMLSNFLGVKPIEILFYISNNEDSYGWCKKVGNNECLIHISEWVVGTPSEENVVQHELCHAYQTIYLPEKKMHGPNFRHLTNKVFNHHKVKKPWVNRIDLCGVKIDNDKGIGKVYYDGELKAQIDLTNALTVDENGCMFKHPNTATIYGYIFMEVMKNFHTNKRVYEKLV